MKLEIPTKTKTKIIQFVSKCKLNDNSYSFYPKSEESFFGLCFSLFIYNSLSYPIKNKQKIYFKLISNLKTYRKINENNLYSKNFLQLLCFTLSALKIINKRSKYIDNLIIKLIPQNLEFFLNQHGVLRGKPGSGNIAMFIGIFLIHAYKVLKKNKYKKDLTLWIELHKENQNMEGFWGKKNFSLSYSNFQNGYHQYEIFNYLKLKTNIIIPKNLSTYQNYYGNFSPYMGGGSCFDYDAIYLITHYDNIKNSRPLLEKTFNFILNSQNIDGGFSESKSIRPLSKLYSLKWLVHIFYTCKVSILFTRIRSFLAMNLKKNNVILTHWSKNPRNWDQSNLWDTWFRLMALGLIERKLNKGKTTNHIKKINYPGIGFFDI